MFPRKRRKNARERRDNRPRTASGRANLAARLLTTLSAWPRGEGLGRPFDDCFEAGDGDEVYRLLVDRAAADAPLRHAMLSHGFSDWADAADARAAELAARPLAPMLFD